MTDLSDVGSVDMIKALIARGIDKRFYAKVYDDHIRNSVREYNERQVKRSEEWRKEHPEEEEL